MRTQLCSLGVADGPSGVFAVWAQVYACARTPKQAVEKLSTLPLSIKEKGVKNRLGMLIYSS
jgi:hypothetical protein